MIHYLISISDNTFDTLFNIQNKENIQAFINKSINDYHLIDKDTL